MKPKLNALVAEYILGMKTTLTDDLKLNWSHALPDYSGDIACAWKIVEKLEPTFRLELHRYTKGWLAVFEPNDDRPSAKEVAPTAAEAICLAALATRP